MIEENLHNNKDENVHRFALERERERERGAKTWHDKKVGQDRKS